MLIFFGVLSILLSAVIIFQSAYITMIMSMFNASEIGGVWMLVALGFLVSGILSLCSSKGRKYGLVVASTLFLALTALLSTSLAAIGDMAVYTAASYLFLLVYCIWLIRHRKSRRVKQAPASDSSNVPPSQL